MGALAARSTLRRRFAPRVFLDRGLTTASQHHHARRIGRADPGVMLVMLLGQTRVLYSMASDGVCCRKKFFAAVHPKFRTPLEETPFLWGLPGGCRGQALTPIDDIGKDG